MDEDEEPEQEPEELEVMCESCREVGYADDTIDCPRFEEDMGRKGVRPGWIHKSCCGEEFINDPRGCIECCQDEELLSKNVREHFEACLNSDELIKDKSPNGVPVLLTKNTLSILQPKLMNSLNLTNPSML